MTWVFAAALIAFLAIAGCTVITIKLGSQPVNIQTTDSTNVLGSQNVTSAPRSAKGDAGGAADTDSTAVTPVTITPGVKR